MAAPIRIISIFLRLPIPVQRVALLESMHQRAKASRELRCGPNLEAHSFKQPPQSVIPVELLEPMAVWRVARRPMPVQAARTPIALGTVKMLEAVAEPMEAPEVS